MHSAFILLNDYNKKNRHKETKQIFSDAGETLTPQGLSKDEEHSPVSESGYSIYM